ncbi:hypothetical protein ACIHEI_33975 [Kitasatospora sp. NPDC051984]|uniref:hypothetical protein n=1 Tax=Kitasatospora sp. NPDC051984 TaxID=3364059 RepID=UPI0037CA945D
MTDAEFSGSSIERAWEPPEEVVVPYALAYSPGLQPEDYGVLIRLLLRDPDQPSGILALAEEFQASGWKMGASRLRGVLGRLQKAGHVSHERDGYDKETGRPKWRFRVYRNPANNSAYVNRGAAAASQVSPMVRNPTRRGAQTGSDGAISNIYAGQTDGAVSDVSETDGVVSDTSETNIYAGQTDGAVSNTSVPSPPHPPVVGTTPPSPPVTADPSVAADAETGRGRGVRSAKNDNPAVDSEALEAAVSFLLELPAPFACGLRNAKRFAPKLLEATALLGWELGPDLAKELTGKTAAGLKDPSSAIGKRIADLRRRQVVLRDSEPAVPPARQPVIPQDPDFKPVPAPAKVADLLAGLRKPNI